MYHVNDLLVKTRHEDQQAEIVRDFEHRELASYSSKSSRGQAGVAMDRLGDGLIRLGQRLKDGDNSTPSQMDLTFDCD